MVRGSLAIARKKKFKVYLNPKFLLNIYHLDLEPVEVISNSFFICNVVFIIFYLFIVKIAYVESWKAIELANSIFGFTGWSSNIVDLTPDFIEEIGTGNNVKYRVGVTAIVKLTLKDGTFHEDVGYGVAENKNKGKAIENAKKESVTDARKRALRLFGNGLGNSVYDRCHTKSEMVNINNNVSQVVTYESLRKKDKDSDTSSQSTPPTKAQNISFSNIDDFDDVLDNVNIDINDDFVTSKFSTPPKQNVDSLPSIKNDPMYNNTKVNYSTNQSDNNHVSPGNTNNVNTQMQNTIPNVQVINNSSNMNSSTQQISNNPQIQSVKQTINSQMKQNFQQFSNNLPTNPQTNLQQSENMNKISNNGINHIKTEEFDDNFQFSEFPDVDEVSLEALSSYEQTMLESKFNEKPGNEIKTINGQTMDYRNPPNQKLRKVIS